MGEPGDRPKNEDAPFLGAILDHLAHPVFVKDRDSRFVLLNDAFCEMVGYPREEMLGKTDHDFFPKEQSDFFRQKDLEMFSSGAKVDIEEEPITDAYGRLHVLTTTKVPLYDRDGNVTHLVGIIQDITRRKAAEEALRRANEALEDRVRERTEALEEAQARLLRRERLAALGQLAGGVAHQIRNPLAAIINAASVIRRRLGSAGDPDAQQAVDIILEEVRRSNQIITDLIDYGRVRPAVRSPVALHQVVDNVLMVEAPPSSIAVEERIAPDLTIVVDEEQLTGALTNIFRNAYEAMSDGGRLTVAAHRDDEHVTLEISDTGPGVDPEQLERLFEPLVTTKPFGLGLGLAIAQTLIQNQGGSIGCDSAPGQGCRFTIRLPVDVDS